MGENSVLFRLFRHHLWANDRMVRACSALTDEQLDIATSGTYGRLSQTLIHLARAQGGYVRTLTGWQPAEEHRLEYDDPFPGVDRVAWHLGVTGEALVKVARQASSERLLEGTWGNEPYRFPEWVVLLQAAHHATEHRQQIATSLTTLGIEPPEPDLWAYWDVVRASDL